VSEQKIRAFLPDSEEYRRAFDCFLRHTDQKQVAFAELRRLCDALAKRDVLIDAGAGNGVLTSWLADRFRRVIAIEPSEGLRRQIPGNCPRTEILPQTILEADPGCRASLVLCSHVFYHVEQGAWLAHLERLASWLDKEGLLVVCLENPSADCQKMVWKFSARRFDLQPLLGSFRARHSTDFCADIHTLRSEIKTDTPDDAFTIAEFLLSSACSPPLGAVATVDAVKDYIATHFSRDGGFSFSCDQDFMLIRRR